MRSSYGIDIELFQYLNLSFHTFPGNRVPGFGVKLVAVYSLDQNWFAVQEDLFIDNLNNPETKHGWDHFQGFSLGIQESDEHRI